MAEEMRKLVGALNQANQANRRVRELEREAKIQAIVVEICEDSDQDCPKVEEESNAAVSSEAVADHVAVSEIHRDSVTPSSEVCAEDDPTAREGRAEDHIFVDDTSLHHASQ